MPDIGEFVPELVCMGVDFIICGVLYKAYSTTNNILRDLSRAPQIPIDDHLSSSIQDHSSSVANGDATTYSIAYAVIRGDVSPLGKEVISSYSADMVKGVIQKVVFTEHKRNMSRTGFWVDSERLLHQYTNDAPFCLTNTQDSLFSLIRPHVEVLDWNDASRVDLDTVYDNFESSGGGLGSHIWGWVVGDMQKGVQKTEMMLTKGTTLTGIGELVSGPMGIKLQPPSDGRPYYLVKNSLASLIKEIEGNRTVFKVFLGIFGSVGALISGVALWKYYKKIQAEKEARVNQERLNSIRAERSNRPARETGDNVPETITCVVCLGAEREVILLDCGHVCVCADCADELLRAGQSCPVCRAAIVRVMPAYVS